MSPRCVRPLSAPGRIIAPVTDTLAGVPAQQIATTLPLINWTVLAALAVGSFAVVAAARLFTPATKGFLSFTAACAAGFGLLTYLSDAGLPTVPSTAIVTADPAFDVPRRVALAVFVLVAVDHDVRDRPRRAGARAAGRRDGGRRRGAGARGADLGR